MILLELGETSREESSEELACLAPLPFQPARERKQAERESKRTSFVNSCSIVSTSDVLTTRWPASRSAMMNWSWGESISFRYRRTCLTAGSLEGRESRSGMPESARERASKQAAGRAWVAMGISGEVSERVWEGGPPAWRAHQVMSVPVNE